MPADGGGKSIGGYYPENSRAHSVDAGGGSPGYSGNSYDPSGAAAAASAADPFAGQRGQYQLGLQ